MIGVQVSDQHARDGFIIQVVLENIRPDFAGGMGKQPGIHQRPALAIAQQPHIDMIEQERQRQPQPLDVRGDIPNFTGFRAAVNYVLDA